MTLFKAYLIWLIPVAMYIVLTVTVVADHTNPVIYAIWCFSAGIIVSVFFLHRSEDYYVKKTAKLHE